MPDEYLSPKQIVESLAKALTADRMRLEKMESELPKLKATVRKAEAFIRKACETWNLELPPALREVGPPILVSKPQKPEGVAVVNGFPCGECDRTFESKQGRAVHVNRTHRGLY